MRVAFDFEMCPLPEHAYTDRQRRRRDMEVAQVLRRKPDMDPADADRLARSTHAHLGWICVGALAWRDSDHQVRTWATSASTPDAEPEMLRAFADRLNSFGYIEPVSYSGKRFDAPFYTVRCLAHGVQMGDNVVSIQHDHRYQDRPHLDLQHKLPMGYGLADLCEILGVETPKGDIDGSQVAGCVERGEIDRVVTYCKADVRATLLCYERLASLCAL